MFFVRQRRENCTTANAVADLTFGERHPGFADLRSCNHASRAGQRRRPLFVTSCSDRASQVTKVPALPVLFFAEAWLHH